MQLSRVVEVVCQSGSDCSNGALGNVSILQTLDTLLPALIFERVAVASVIPDLMIMTLLRKPLNSSEI